MFQRQFLVKMHLIMAAIILPLVMMFLLTGGLYTSEYEPSMSSEEYRTTLSSPLKYDYNGLKALASEELKKLGIDEPTDDARVKFDRKIKAYKLVWYGKNHDVILRASTRNQAEAVITVKTPSWYGRFMRLHKADGGDVFAFYAIGATIILLLILVTGVLIGLKTKLYRKLTIRALSLGSLLFISMVVYAQF